MDMTTQDYLKKALIDTQERVRDFMNYSDQIKNTQLKDYFKEFAEIEGHQAQKLKGFIDEMQM